MYLRNCWYAAGWIHDFAGEGTHARTMLDEPLVFYRRKDGRLVAFEDRCCHRLAPLSKGQVEGDDLRCMYHGLRFNPQGQCIEIPGQPQIPAGTCVRTYPVIEKHSIAWVWMGDVTRADEALIPPFVGLDSEHYSMLPGRMDYDANYMLINDNLLDLSHLSFVHANTFGAPTDFSDKRPKITRLERGLRVDRWLLGEPPAKYMADQMPSDARFDVHVTYDFLVPGIFLLDSLVYPAGHFETYGGEVPDSELLHREYTCQAVTPLTSTKSCYLFAYGPWSRMAELAPFYLDLAYKIFGEDNVMIEAQQRIVDRSPGRKMQATSHDAAPNQYRWVLDKLIAAERAERNDQPETHRTVKLTPA